MSIVVLRSEPGFADRLSAFAQAISIRHAESEEDREAIFRLRYEAYLREGAIKPNFGQRFADRFDETDNVWLFGIKLEGTLVSSIRIHVATEEYPESPTVDAFADILRPMLRAGTVIVDPSRFVADRVASRLHPELPYVTARIAVVAMEYFQADIGAVAVRREHQAFYRKVFAFTPVAPPRKYHGLIKPLGLMTARQVEVRDRVLGRYPFLRSTMAERVAIFGPLSETPVRKIRPLAEPAKAQLTA